MFSVRPLPVGKFGLVDTILVGVVSAFDLHIFELGFGMCTSALKLWNSVDDIHGNCEAVNLVIDCQLQRRVDVAFFLIAAHVKIGVIGASVSESMDQPRIAVEVEHHRFIPGEQSVEI